MMPRWLYVLDTLAVAWFIAGIFYPPLLIAWFVALALTCVVFYGIWRGIHWLRRNPAGPNAEALENAAESAEALGEPRTTDYCVACGESPDSGSHLPHGHEYVDPRHRKGSL